MSSCQKCQYYDKEAIACSLKCDKGGRSFTRNCVYAIWREEAQYCVGKVLEIGGGHWSPPRKALRKRSNCEYFGVDPRWADNPELGGYKGTAAHIPFEDNFFDRILAFETMEHWGENGEPPAVALKEVYRVLKPDCTACITVPIHLHGTKEFVDGDMETIKGYFDNPMWKNVRYEEWRKDYEPLPPSQNWRGTLEHFKKCSTQKIPSSWTLRINAEKNP